MPSPKGEPKQGRRFLNKASEASDARRFPSRDLLSVFDVSWLVDLALAAEAQQDGQKDIRPG